LTSHNKGVLRLVLLSMGASNIKFSLVVPYCALRTFGVNDEREALLAYRGDHQHVGLAGAAIMLSVKADRSENISNRLLKLLIPIGRSILKPLNQIIFGGWPSESDSLEHLVAPGHHVLETSIIHTNSLHKPFEEAVGYGKHL